ncbi:MAG: Fe-S metabolism protein SufE [Oligoflexia bacterium]|nr:MAG: Fe-S metabolism protein SufE [Oligoflexia bacterium]
MSIQTRQEALIQEFGVSSNWEDRYKKIIAYGKTLPEFPEQYRTEDNRVKGCQSQVWLHAQLNDKGEIEFQGDSDALIVKGLVAVLIKIYSGATPSDIILHPPSFIQALGFEGNLSPSRANGLFSMIKQIRHYAMAYQALQQMQKK